MIELRVAGLWRRGAALLLVEHEKGGERYWVVPGGHVERGETLAGAVAREFLEEVAVEVRVGDLVLANDFILADRHAVNLYFAVEAVDPSAVPRAQRTGSVRGARFVAVEELTGIDLRPAIGEILAGYVRTGSVPRTYLGRR